MSNCHNLFQTFHEDISLSKSKKDRMKISKEGIREKIRKYFKENHSAYEPKFYIQGSYKMKSSIRTKEDICDLDDGVYFFRKPDVTSTTLQIWVKEAVEGYTDTAPEHRKKCIRNIFKKDYEIDLPIYYKVDGEEYQLAVKNKDWEDSDSKAMVNWFVGKKDDKGQLVRIVKFLKAWGDFKPNKMPTGLAMTILASNAKEKIVYNERDDITLRDTLNEIKKTLDVNFKCSVPVVPFDDLFSDYEDNRKEEFLNDLNDFIQDANQALKESNQLNASKLWRKHLGGRFPMGEDKNEETKAFTSIVAGAKPSNPWTELKI